MTIFDFLSNFFCLTVPKIFEGEPFCAEFQKISGTEKVWRNGGGGYQDFTSKIFCLTVPKISVGNPWGKRGGEYQDFLSKIFCLTVPKIFVGESFTVALISGSEKVWIGGGGVSRFSVENFLSHSAENLRRESVGEEGGEYQDFLSKIFCLTVPKIFVGESFTVALISGSEKVWIGGGGEYQDFLSKIFCLTVPKISVGNPWGKRGGGEYQDFLSKIFCLTVPKIFVGESFTVALISGSEKVWIGGGGEYQNIPSKFFCLTVPKKFVGESFSNSINSCIEKC